MSGLRLNPCFFTQSAPAQAVHGDAPSDQHGAGRPTDSLAPAVPPTAPMASLPPRPNLPVIVLTGGPCGGKSTLLRKALEPGRWGDTRLAAAPELATLYTQHGLDCAAENTVARQQRFERDLVQLQCAQETFMGNHAANLPMAALICDRGALDAAAYCDPSIWSHVLADLGTTAAQLGERYDLVLHVTSVAVDAPELYNRDNNKARWESSEDAAALDARTALAWLAHPNRQVLGNDFANFEDKIEAGCRLIGQFLADYAHTHRVDGQLRDAP